MEVEDAPALLEQAQECMNSLPEDVDGAVRKFTRALQLYPNNADVVEAFGEFLCLQGCVDEAREFLNKAILLRPTQNPAKYFYLGQMANGREALRYFQDGLSIQDPDGKVSARISAFCSIAELFMTDLCDEDDAQQNVEKALTEALQLDANSVEANTSAAMYRKVIGELDVAKDHCKKAIQAMSGINLDELPCSEIRTGLCKVMIDLQMTEEVQPLLQQLLDEDEEDVHALYMVCCAHLADQDIDAVEECFEKAVEICKRCPETQECWGEILQKFHDGPLAKLREEADKEDADEEDAVAAGG